MKKYLSYLIEKYNNSPIQIRASFWFLFCSFLSRGISSITTPIFTRIFTTSEFGEYGVFMSWFGIMTPIISLNLSSGVYSQGLVKFEDDRDLFSSSLQGLTLTLIVGWLVVYILFNNVLNLLLKSTTSKILLMFALIWLNATFQFWSVNQRVDFKYRSLAIITAVTSILQPIICIVLIRISNNRVLARILGMVLVQTVMYGWTFFYHQFKGKSFYNGHYWKYALKFNIPLLPHYLSLVILSTSDRIMIERLVGQSEAGIYYLAYNLSQIMTMFNTALSQTIEPWIFKKLKDNRIDDIKKVAYPSFVFIAIANIGLIAFAPEVISIFAPAEYYNAIWIVPPVALSVFFTFLYSFFATFEFYFEKTNYIVSATIVGAIFNIILNYVFISTFGYNAAGYTTLVCYIMFAALHYYFMRKICKENLNNANPYDARIIGAISLLTLVSGFILLFTYNIPILRYIVIIMAFVIVVAYRKYIIDKIELIINLKKEK